MSRQARHPLREPMLWLIVGIPVATVVAGVWTLVLASGASATDSTPDRVQRTAQVQQSDLSADATAARLQLHAELSLVGDQVEIRIARLPAQSALELLAVHPLDAGNDRRLRFEVAGDSLWRGPALPADNDWNLSLQPAQGNWRLVGRWRKDDTRILLQPALPGR